MGSAFGIYNSTKADLWFVLRSSNQEGALLKVPPNGNNIIRLGEGEIVTSFCFTSKEEAEASIGKSEKFITVEASR
jgi:hypothetical protein